MLIAASATPEPPSPRHAYATALLLMLPPLIEATPPPFSSPRDTPLLRCAKAIIEQRLRHYLR